MTLVKDTPETPVANGLRVDSLAAGMSLLLVLTVLQRVLGFGRNLLFCRWLEPRDLGLWNLSFSLLILAAPLVVLGLPGSFGRYVEYYRQRGMLKTFIIRTTAVTLVCTVIGVTVLCYCQETFAWFFFGDAAYTEMLWTTGICLIFVIAFNFLVELFTALRQVRTVSFMQLSNGLLFAVFALSLIHLWEPTARSIVIGYALACVVTCGAALIAMAAAWKSIQNDGPPIAHAQLWLKLLPFAGFIWFNDLLNNLFAAADRYMIIHFHHSAEESATEVIGQYHSSLVVPALLLSIANMVSSVVLPYISHNWELGNFATVSRRLNNALKLYGLGAVCAAAGVLVMSPVIFDWALGGKYSGGLAVLPWTLTFCVWAGLAVITNQYVFCAERALHCRPRSPGRIDHQCRRQFVVAALAGAARCRLGHDVGARDYAVLQFVLCPAARAAVGKRYSDRLSDAALPGRGKRLVRRCLRRGPVVVHPSQ